MVLRNHVCWIQCIHPRCESVSKRLENNWSALPGQEKRALHAVTATECPFICKQRRTNTPTYNMFSADQCSLVGKKSELFCKQKEQLWCKLDVFCSKLLFFLSPPWTTLLWQTCFFSERATTHRLVTTTKHKKWNRKVVRCSQQIFCNGPQEAKCVCVCRLQSDRGREADSSPMQVFECHGPRCYSSLITLQLTPSAT